MGISRRKHVGEKAVYKNIARQDGRGGELFNHKMLDGLSQASHDIGPLTWFDDTFDHVFGTEKWPLPILTLETNWSVMLPTTPPLVSLSLSRAVSELER
jgi:hypothetical protein